MNLMKIDKDITVAGPADAATLAAIASETFYETWRPVNTEEDMQQYLAEAFAIDRMENELSSPANTFLLARHGNDVVGYAKVRRDRTHTEFGDASTLEIVAVYVQGR